MLGREQQAGSNELQSITVSIIPNDSFALNERTGMQFDSFHGGSDERYSLSLIHI